MHLRSGAAPRVPAIGRWVGAILGLTALGWSNPARGGTADATLLNDLKRSVIENYAAGASAAYRDSVNGARRLLDAVDKLLEAPGPDTLTLARHAWLEARTPYLQTEVFRFYDGPIDAVEGLVNAWPIDENLIDYVEGDPGAGIINQPETYPAITRDLLVTLNERDGERSITAGFHAIEFLLWGQDLNDDGPGDRPFLDYDASAARFAKRRGEYLRIATRLLVEDLEAVVAEWAEGNPDNFRSAFLALPPDEALTRIFKGAGILTGAELAGERLTVPYETKEQEDEHSCFSDSTHRDLVNDAVGIRNVFQGRYVSTFGGSETELRGPGIHALLARVEPALASKLAEQIDTSVTASAAIPAPFDRAISGRDTTPGRIAVKRAAAAFRAESDLIAQAGASLGLKLTF